MSTVVHLLENIFYKNIVIWSTKNLKVNVTVVINEARKQTYVYLTTAIHYIKTRIPQKYSVIYLKELKS